MELIEVSKLSAVLENKVISVEEKDQITITVSENNVLAVCEILKNHDDLQMACLLDLCCVDYLHYGVSEWETDDATSLGYSRAQAVALAENTTWKGPRFVIVCHLLSYIHKARVRVRVHLDDKLGMPSLTGIWGSANWYEREAYDLFGVIFYNHPDFRRILTDYGFVGYPFRKDFPLCGKVEMRYDGKLEKCIYEPVQIENRIGVPKVIRQDHRYLGGEDATG